MATTYSHLMNGKHLRYVEVLSVTGSTATVKATAGRMAGMVYDVDVTVLVGRNGETVAVAAEVAAEVAADTNWDGFKDCSFCGAEAGTPCVIHTQTSYIVRATPHRSREVAATPAQVVAAILSADKVAAKGYVQERLSRGRETVAGGGSVHYSGPDRKALPHPLQRFLRLSGK